MRLRDQWLAVTSSRQGRMSRAVSRAMTRRAISSMGRLCARRSGLHHLWPQVVHVLHQAFSGVPRLRSTSRTIWARALGSGSSRSMRSLSLPASLMCLFF